MAQMTQIGTRMDSESELTPRSNLCHLRHLWIDF